MKDQASGRLVPLLVDVTDSRSVSQAAGSVTGALDGGPLAGLVNNAGIVVGGPLETLPPEQLRRQFEVNVIGTLAVTQAMLPLLRASKGRIVNMGSFAGRVAVPYIGAYAASKHALEAITDAQRMELRRWHIGVSLVEPGSVRTPIWDKVRFESQQVLDAMTPQTEALYGDDMRTMREASVRLAQHGMPLERVVRAVVHALSARRPKTRYPLGFQTRLAFIAFKFLPAAARDWCVCRGLGLR